MRPVTVQLFWTSAPKPAETAPGQQLTQKTQARDVKNMQSEHRPSAVVQLYGVVWDDDIEISVASSSATAFFGKGDRT